MTSRKATYLTIVIAVVLIASAMQVWVGSRFFWLPPMNQHSGDGNFQDLSYRIGPLAMPAYAVSMPEFDLGTNLETQYRVQGLPSSRRCGVHLAIRDPQLRWWDDTMAISQLKGELSLELLDSKGKTLVKVNGNLGSYTWWGLGRERIHVLYKNKQSFFAADPAEAYTIRFRYSPDPCMAGYKGFVYLLSRPDYY